MKLQSKEDSNTKTRAISLGCPILPPRHEHESTARRPESATTCIRREPDAWIFKDNHAPCAGIVRTRSLSPERSTSRQHCAVDFFPPLGRLLLSKWREQVLSQQLAPYVVLPGSEGPLRLSLCTVFFLSIPAQCQVQRIQQNMRVQATLTCNTGYPHRHALLPPSPTASSFQGRRRQDLFREASARSFQRKHHHSHDP